MRSPGLVATRRAEGDRARVVALAAAVFIGAFLVRGALLWPKSVALIESPYDDEGVYAAAAQLLAQGALPYRDFFYGHPPAGPLAYLPAVLYHFTAWGSPTSFLDARYLALLYSALTAAVGSIVASRLWGMPGGALAGLLLAVDPQLVWTGRHVMLEAPLLLLTASAALAYATARGRAGAAPGWLVVAGLCGGLAGAVKLPGLVILAAIALDLLSRRRWHGAAMLALGAGLAWLPVAAFVIWQRASDPLGQFVWFQLLRPGDGVRGALPRVMGLVSAGPLTALLGLAAVVALRAVTLAPEVLRGAGRTAAVSGSGPPVPVAASRAVAGSPGAPRGAARRANDMDAGRSLLGWWLLLTVAMLFLSRSFYAHYGAQLALPLAILAGALPALLARGLRADAWARRLTLSLGLALGLLGLLAFASAVRADFSARPDGIYQLVGRYVGDAARPGQAVFALDAQFPFLAARPPAREYRGRYIVDGYGSLLYNGLGLAGASLPTLAGRLFAPPLAADPYAVMWRPEVQRMLVTAIEDSDVAVIDAKSDGRLTDETRRWLASRGVLVERQERYAIYRIRR